MTLINHCRGMALEIVQRSEAPNDAWQNFESHFRAKRTREILRLSHEVNGKTMQPGEDPFQFMVEVDRLVADLHRLGDKPIKKLKKCVSWGELSAHYEIEVRMLENNPAGLERAEIECVVGNQNNRLLRHQVDSKALSASGGTTNADHGEKKRRSRNRFEGNCSNCGRKGRHAKGCRSAKKKIRNQEMPRPTRRAEVGESATSVGVRSIGNKHCGLCRSLEHRTRGCEERGAEKGVVLAKINVPANAEMRLVTATTGATRGYGKEEWDSNSDASFHMSHTQAGMTAYKKAPGTTVEAADGTILPVDGFKIVEVNLDQSGTTTKIVKIISIACMPGLSWNLLSIRKAVKR